MGTCQIVDFAVPADHKVKLKECEKKDKNLYLARELKKTVEHKKDGYTNCNWCSWYCHQRIGTRTGGLGNNRMSGDHSNYSIIEIGQNTEKSSGLLETCCLSNSSEKPSVNADVKTHQQ